MKNSSRQVSQAVRCLQRLVIVLLLTRVSGLSIRNCRGTNSTSGLWKHASNPTSPSLTSHSATVYTDSQSHDWMLITGGYSKQQDDEFHVWAMNLTHSEMFDEEQWIRMNMANVPSCIEDKPSLFTRPDPFADLWSNATHCPPSPRGNHVTGIFNGYLYVFGGFLYSATSLDSNFDPHVYRIWVDDILTGNPSSWERILPRVPLTYHGALKGGMWQHHPSLAPEMVVLIENSRYDQVLWSYDFIQDQWEKLSTKIPTPWYFSNIFSVAIVQDNMFLLDRNGRVIRVNLATRLVEALYIISSRDHDIQILAGYQDSVINKANMILRLVREQDPIVISPYSVDHRGVVFQDDSSPPSLSPSKSSVVLSNGRMYIFGGDLSRDTQAVWSLDVGSKECKLGKRRETNDDDDSSISRPLLIFLCVLGGVLVLWVLISLCVCIYDKLGEWQAERQQGQDNDDTYPRGINSQPPINEAPHKLDQLPQRVLSDTDGALDCSICLEPFEVGDMVRDLPCKHYFHRDCIDSMDDACAAQMRRTCPLCRTPIEIVNNAEDAV